MSNSKKTKDRTADEKLPALPILRNQRLWDIIKAVLRLLCVALSVIIVGEIIALGVGSPGLFDAGWVVYPLLAAMLLWDITEFVVIITRRSISKGIPPGAHVGVELVLWLGTIATVIAESLKLNWGRLTLSVEDQILEELDNWVRVTLTQFSFLSLLIFLRFIFFVRACVEVDRRKKDRRVQQLVLAIQKQGKNPQDFPLSAYRAVQELDHDSSTTVLSALSTSTRSLDTNRSVATSQRPRTAPEERDFGYKYNFPIATVPELLESGIHPEDSRNQKVLIGAFPR